MSAYFEIAYAAASGRLCFFTGTGFSKAVTDNAAPSWQSLLETMCTHLSNGAAISSALFPATGNNPLPLEEAAQVIDIEFQQIGLSLHESIAKHISGVVLSGDNSLISRFFEGKSFDVVTTNYDKLMEQLIGSNCHSIAPGLPIPRAHAPVSVYHVHGSVDSPRKMVVTSDDYFKFLNGDSYFSRKLSTILYENTVVILGYSLGDTNLKSILSDYKGFSRSNFVGASIFIVSRSLVSQHIKDYYSHSLGIRVIDNTSVHQFFNTVTGWMADAEKCVTASRENIRKAIHNGYVYTDHYLRVQSSFFEIIAAIPAVGMSITSDKVVELIGSIVKRKSSFTLEYNAWDQYTHLARWLIHLCCILELRGTPIESAILEAVHRSMSTMISSNTRGYSWHAYNAWASGWSNIAPANRALIRSHIERNCHWPDALTVVRSV